MGWGMQDGAGSHPVNMSALTLGHKQPNQAKMQVTGPWVCPPRCPRGNPRSFRAAEGKAAPDTDLFSRATVPPGNISSCSKSTQANPKETAPAQERRKRHELVSMKENLAQRHLLPCCALQGGQKSSNKGQLSPSRQAAVGGRTARSSSKALRMPSSGRAAAPALGESSFEGRGPERRNRTAPRWAILQKK